MLKQYVSEYDFRDWFLGSDTYKHNFSYDGLTALYEYLEALSEDIGEDIEFDPVAIACEYGEEHWSDIADDYDVDLSDCEDDNEQLVAVQWYLDDNTCLVAVLDNGNMVYMAF